MSGPTSSPSGQPRYEDLQALWSKYEDIAMHFNDLLMRLRSQALAGIAAISTLVGIFTKGGAANIQGDWIIATAIFIGLALFWIAIWCLDFLYYNRLLIGAVAAIVGLEEKSKKAFVNFDGIDMSTRIVEAFEKRSSYASFLGVLMFYSIVLATIFSGALFCWHMQNVLVVRP